MQGEGDPPRRGGLRGEGVRPAGGGLRGRGPSAGRGSAGGGERVCRLQRRGVFPGRGPPRGGGGPPGGGGSAPAAGGPRSRLGLGRGGRGAGRVARRTVAFTGTFSSEVGQRRRHHGSQRGRRRLRHQGRVRGGDGEGFPRAAAAGREGASTFQSLEDQLADFCLNFMHIYEKVWFADRLRRRGLRGCGGREWDGKHLRTCCSNFSCCWLAPNRGDKAASSGASETKPLSLENTRMDCCVGTRLISATNVAEGSETVLSGLGKTETRLLLRARCRLGRAGRPFSCEAGLQTFGVVITLYSCYPQHFYLKSVVGTFRRLIKNLNI